MWIKLVIEGSRILDLWSFGSEREVSFYSSRAGISLSMVNFPSVWSRDTSSRSLVFSNLIFIIDDSVSWFVDALAKVGNIVEVTDTLLP